MRKRMQDKVGAAHKELAFDIPVGCRIRDTARDEVIRGMLDYVGKVAMPMHRVRVFKDAAGLNVGQGKRFDIDPETPGLYHNLIENSSVESSGLAIWSHGACLDVLYLGPVFKVGNLHICVFFPTLIKYFYAS